MKEQPAGPGTPPPGRSTPLAARQPSPAARQPSPAARQPSPAARQPSPAARQPSPAAREPSRPGRGSSLAVTRDEVDDLVAAWQVERPDLDVAPLQVLSRVSRLARHLDRARRAAFAAHDLETWEFDVLSALRRQGPPYQLTPGALLRATLVTSGTMTNRIDRLAAAGLVRREPDPQDRRGVLVTLTGAGRSRVDAALADLVQNEDLLLNGLSTADRTTLADLLRVLLAPLDA